MERHAGVTSTRRNSAERSSSSREAISIARASTTFTGLREGRGSASWISVPIVRIAGSRSTPTPYPGRKRPTAGTTWSTAQSSLNTRVPRIGYDLRDG